MGIIAAGQITVVDLSDAPVLNTFITASRPTTQTYSKDSGTYKPSYASTPQVLTLKLTKAGSTANIIDSISSLHWFVVDGPVKTEITSKDNTANEYISGAHNEVLTTKLDIDKNKGSKRYEVMGIWPDPSTGLDVQFGGYIDLLLTQNGATGPQGPQGDTGNGIANTVITYGLSMSDTTEPATWSSEMPTLVKGMYLWTRTVIIYTNGSSTTSYQISYIAKDADATAEIDKAKQELLEKLETVRDESLEAVDEAKQQLVTVRDESLAAAEEAKQGLNNVTSELNTAKQNLADSVTAVNTKVDSAKEELTQAKQQLTTVADDLSTAKQDFQNAVSAVDTKATNLKSDLAQAKQDLASQAQQLREQASAQSELTNRVSSVEETANGMKTTVSELSKTVDQNGKDITSVTARTKVVEDDLAGTKTTLSQVKTTADSTSQKTATLETGLNGLSAKFNSLSVGNKNYLPASRVVNRGCSNFSYSNTTKSWTMTVPASSTTFGNGITFNTSGLNILLNGGETLFFGLMIKTNKACSFNYDVNNTLSGTTSNDNDDTSKRAHSPSNKSIPANVWTRVWFSYTAKANVAITEKNSNFGIVNNTEPVAIEIKEVMVAKSNVPVDYQAPDADLEQKIAEYKQNADQNYASLQTTVQNLDGTVQHNKTVADQTAQGFTTRIESLETYKDGESTRANQYFESARTETARQLTAERTAIAKDYVAKSTYTSDVTGIRNDLSATTTTANTTKTNLANYQASNDRAVANLQSNLQTANGNISSLKTKVEAVPGQITSAVSSVESKIPTEIGGVNLLRNSKGPFKPDRGVVDNYAYYDSSTVYLEKNQSYVISGLTDGDFSDTHENNQESNRVVLWLTDKPKGINEVVSDSNTGTKGTRFTWVNDTGTYCLRVNTYKKVADKSAWNIQVEKGNVKSDYAQSPLDTDADITRVSSEIQQTADGMTLLATKTELNTAKNELQFGITTATSKADNAQATANSNAQTISTHTTQISALNTGLSAKVSQTDFNTLSGRVTTAENNITAKANELSSKISSVEGKIPTSVGGRNYIKDSEYRKTSITVNDNQVQDEVFNISPAFWQNSNVYNKKIKLSFYYQPSVAYGTERKFPVYFRESPWPWIGEATYPANTTRPIKYTMAMSNALPANFTANQIFIRFTGNLDKGRDHIITKVMLEVSDVFSDWSPAPEDTIEEISSLSSELKQTKDGITLLATKTELSTAKNDLQSGINTATNKANAAQNTANSAQNKANSNAQTISTHTTQISALNTGLNAKVSQTDFNTLSGRVTTAENNITAKANELSSKITSVEGKIPSGEMNLVEYGRPVDGYNRYAGAEYAKHPFYYNGSLKMYIIKNTTTSEKMLGMNRFKVERNTEYTLYFKGFNNGSLTNMDVWFLKRVNGSTKDWDSAQQLVVGRKLSVSRAEDISVTFNTGDYDEGWLRFDNNGTATAGVQADLYFGDVSVKKGKSNNGWSPSLAELASSQDLKSTQSELKQTKDGITLLATKTELNTAKSDLQSGINTATNKANSAQNTANSAQNKANSNAQTISTHTNQISALNTGLQAKVSQTEFNTLSGRVTTAENNITAKANELSSKITSVEGKIPTEIGSSNLLRKTAVNTENLKLFGKSNSTISVVTKDGHQTYKIVVSANGSGVYFDGNSEYYNLVKDRYYTFSFWVLTNKNKNYNMNSLGHIQAVNNNSDKVGSDALHQHTSPVYSTSVVKANTWTKVWCTFKATSNSYFKPYFWYLNSGDEIYIYDMMLNEGKVPLSYTPAPEDTISQINAVSSELKQTADGITLLATKTELNTAKSDLQSGINTATNKANAAQNTANSAQSTANSAQNKANSNAQTISTHTTQISALNTGLSAKVSQTDFNTLSGRVTSAENNITAKANELSSKITSVDGKIPTSVSQRNLAQGTSDRWTSFVNITTNNNWCYDLATINYGDKTGIYAGTTINLFVYLSADEIVLDSSINPRLYIQGMVIDKSGNETWTNWDKYHPFHNKWSTNLVSGNNYRIVKLSTKVTNDSYSNIKGFKISIRIDGVRTGKFHYRALMVTTGDVFPDYWQPAPEDAINQINAVSSEFKQTTDSIKASVTSLDKSTVKSSSLTINSDGIVMKAGKSTTDVANAIGSYFSVNQNAINLFSDKINVKGSMIVNGTITGDKIKASSVDVSKIVGIDANFIKSKIEYAMIDWLKGKTITAYNDNMTIDLQNGRVSFKDGSNAVYRQTPDGIHTGFLHFEAGSIGGVYAAFGTTSTRQGINSKSSEFAGIRCYRVSANGDSHDAKIDKIEVIGDNVQFGHTYHPNGTIGGGFIMNTAAYYDDPPYSLNRMVSSIESLWRILYVHAKNVGYNLSHPNFIRALNDEYNAWHDMHNR